MNKIQNKIEQVLKVLDKKYNKYVVLTFSKKVVRTGVYFYKNKWYVEIGKDVFRECKQNPKDINHIIRYVVGHEYGHIYHNTPYDTYKQRIMAEYKAERFCLNFLKKHYPLSYKFSILQGQSMLADNSFGNSKKEKHYRIAWNKIKEYR